MSLFDFLSRPRRVVVSPSTVQLTMPRPVPAPPVVVPPPVIVPPVIAPPVTPPVVVPPVVTVPSGVRVLYALDLSRAPIGPMAAVMPWSEGRGLTQNGIGITSEAWTEIAEVDGRRVVRFRQGESVNWSELRFGGLPRLTDVFISYRLKYNAQAATRGRLNDKFFRLWGDRDAAYGAMPGNKVGASLFSRDGRDGEMGLEFQYAGDPVQWAEGQGREDLRPSKYPVPHVPFLTDAIRDRWITVDIHARVASAAHAPDGLLTIAVDGRPLIGSTTLESWSGVGPNSFTDGYLMGWANNGYAPGAVALVDGLTISTGGFAA